MAMRVECFDQRLNVMMDILFRSIPCGIGSINILKMHSGECAQSQRSVQLTTTCLVPQALEWRFVEDVTPQGFEVFGKPSRGQLLPFLDRLPGVQHPLSGTPHQPEGRPIYPELLSVSSELPPIRVLQLRFFRESP